MARADGVRGAWKAQESAWVLALERGRPGAPPLFVQLREGIRQRILEGRLRPGDALIPQRLLCKKLGINQVTATRAIGDLLQEGLLRSEHGRGIFVNDLSPPCVGIVYRRSQAHLKRDGTYGRMVRTAHQRLLKGNVRVQWITREEKRKDLKFGPPLDEVLAADVAAYLTVGIQNGAYLAALVNSGRPVVALDDTPTVADFDGIVADSFREGYLATRHLLELGHRAILFVGHERGAHPGDPSGRARVPEPDSIKREAGYRFALIEAGIEPDPRACFRDLPTPGSAQEKRLEKEIRSRELSGAVVWSDAAAWLAGRVDIPREMSVVTFGPAAGGASRRKWTYCAADLEAWGRAAARRLLRRLHWGGTPSDTEADTRSILVTIAPRFVLGKSTRRVGPPPALYGYPETEDTGTKKKPPPKRWKPFPKGSLLLGESLDGTPSPVPGSEGFLREHGKE